MAFSVTSNSEVVRDAGSEPAPLRVVQERLQLHLARQRGEARTSSAEPEREQWQSFQDAGLNVDRLKALEAESIRHAGPRPEPKPRSDAEFHQRREQLLRNFPANRVLRESKKGQPPSPAPQPKDVPSGVYGDGTVFVADLAVQGSGLGWSEADSRAQSVIAQWGFEFIPPQDGLYLITSFPAAWGSVSGHAHDRFWNSKEFHLQLSCGIGSEQPYDGPMATNEFEYAYWIDAAPQMMFDSDHGNFTLSGDINCPEELQQTVPLRGGVTAVIGCYIVVAAYAQGAGSFAAIDVSLGNLFTSWQLME